MIARLGRSHGMPTGEQIRAARALLGWSVKQLAATAGVSWRTVQRAEAGGSAVPRLNIGTFEKICRALEDAGIEFQPRGVRRR